MPTDETQTAAITTGYAAQPSTPKPPTHSTQNFLSVHVLKGSSTAQIADAVAGALKAREVPFFKDRKTNPANSPSTGASKVQAAVQAGTATAQTTAQGGAQSADDGDGLLILVQQEGWP